ncbi:hypothetical protein H5410_063916 [Solanum commersonii]|uniref:Replication factor A C-terminal domain-containing protein n=1 Tax=Solanum commersonii TaxID=4109 RepID=A0A9J5WH37_SOLCO|nr:hypothetical protein H5410_063916 [Solanum commersonii]
MYIYKDTICVKLNMFLSNFTIQNMALQYNTISEITNNSMNWNLKVCVVRFWTTPDKYKPDIPYSMELILQDEKLRTFDEVAIQHNTDENQLIDVVGLVSYEPIQLSKQGDNSSSFMNIVVEDEKKTIFPATLWGDLAFQMQSHLSGSTDEPLIVVLQLMKTHKFRGEYEKVSQTSSQKHISISEELSTGMVSFKFIKDFLQCTEESTYWIAVKIVCLELGHKWSYLACKKCITKVDPLGDKYYCLKCNVEVISVIHRYQLQIHVTDETGFISLLLWNKEVLQLIGKTAKELKEGLIGDADNEKLMFKVQIKDSNINKNDNVYKVVKFIDDEALLKEYCHPSLIHSLTEASLDCEQSIDEDKLIETPIKNSISDCVSSQTEDVIDLTEKLYPNNGKHVGVLPTHADDEGLNVKLPSNKLRKVIKKEKKV